MSHFSERAQMKHPSTLFTNLLIAPTDFLSQSGKRNYEIDVTIGMICSSVSCRRQKINSLIAGLQAQIDSLINFGSYR